VRNIQVIKICFALFFASWGLHVVACCTSSELNANGIDIQTIIDCDLYKLLRS